MISPDTLRAISNLKLNCSVEQQYELAKALAANCGYQLVAEDTERSLEIKNLINLYKQQKPDDWEILVEGLEALLK